MACIQRTGASVYRQSAAPAASALPSDPPPVITSSCTDAVPATVPPAVVRPHVASTHAEITQMALLAMCTQASPVGGINGSPRLSWDNLEEFMYLHGAWLQVVKWAADKKVLEMDQFFLLALVFVFDLQDSEGRFCCKVTFIGCGINVFS